MKGIVQLEAELALLKEALEDFEIDPNDYIECFDDYLNHVYEGVFGFEPADILRDMDSIRYCEMLDEYIEGVENNEDVRYLRLLDEIKQLEEEIEELEIEVCI